MNTHIFTHQSDNADGNVKFLFIPGVTFKDVLPSLRKTPASKDPPELNVCELSLSSVIVPSSNLNLCEDSGNDRVVTVLTTLLSIANALDPFISAVYVPVSSMCMFVAVPISYVVVDRAPVGNAWILDAGLVIPESFSLVNISKLMKSGIAFVYVQTEP